MKITKIMTMTLLLLFSVIRVAWCGGDEDSATIAALQQTYFSAVQSKDFATAYDMVTENMRDGRTKEKYVEEWEGVMKSAQVDIVDGGVTAIDINGDKARVHAWTRPVMCLILFLFLKKKLIIGCLWMVSGNSI